jgi:ELWxxDGT repeat protein
VPEGRFARADSFFVAETAANGVELWKSDGTAKGTVLVKDIRPGPGSCIPEKPTAVGNNVLFFNGPLSRLNSGGRNPEN